MEKGIKNGWVEVPIENILAPNEKGVILGQGWSPQCEKRPSQSENEWGVLKTTAIQSGYFLEDENKCLPSHLESRTQHEVKSGDLLITCAGPRNRCGVACLVRKTRKKLLISGKMYRFRLNEKKAIPEFIELFLLSQKAWKEIDKMKTGGSDSGLNLTHTRFKKLLVPIPTLPEQLAIVSKIEELLSDLDNGKQQLQTAREQLRVYRQSLLKWAFEGSDFKTFVLKDVTDKIQIGPFGTQLHKVDYVENGIPLINPMHIQDGKIQPNFSYTISNEKKDSLPNYILKEGDVIMGRRGEMGRCGLVTMKEDGWLCGTGSLYFRPDAKKLNSNFLYYYLTSQTVKKFLDENAGGTTMANLNLKIVNDIPISLPPLSEQQLIVSELESKLTVCDKIEETISQSLQQAETLRQSILKQAFEGKLI